ncbi:hypothetical protein FXO37_18203 [Capsicum annuum]|nr:hypothetical protein FXO37_18203 [Capsicum annuum]
MFFLYPGDQLDNAKVHTGISKIWKGIGERSSTEDWWLSIPACVWWTLWRERNARCFEGKSCSIQKIKSHCLSFIFGVNKKLGDTIDLIKQPILFLSGLQDEMVPPFHMQMLYAKAAAHNRQCLFVEFPNGMHMDTWLAGGDHYWRTIQKFLEETVPDTKDDDSKKDKELSSKQNG